MTESATPELPTVPIGVTSQQLAAHQADMKRRQEERDKRCPIEERLKLCNPNYAKETEFRKPVFKWDVECTIYEHKPPQNPDRYTFAEEDEGDPWVPRVIKGTVVAQNEADAWSMFCDKIRHWPSRKLAKPTFTRGAQLDPLSQAVKH